MKKKKMAASYPVALGSGWIAGWIVTLLLAVIISVLIAGEQVQVRMLGPAAVITVVAATFAAASVAAKGAGEKRLVLSIAAGAIYYLSLLCCTALFFDGQFQGLGGAALTIMGTALVTGLLGSKKKTKKHRYAKSHF